MKNRDTLRLVSYGSKRIDHATSSCDRGSASCAFFTETWACRCFRHFKLQLHMDEKLYFLTHVVHRIRRKKIKIPWLTVTQHHLSLAPASSNWILQGIPSTHQIHISYQNVSKYFTMCTWNSFGNSIRRCAGQEDRRRKLIWGLKRRLKTNATVISYSDFLKRKNIRIVRRKKEKNWRLRTPHFSNFNCSVQRWCCSCTEQGVLAQDPRMSMSTSAIKTPHAWDHVV